MRLLPNVEYLRECFSYCPLSGNLYWRERPLSHFMSAANMMTWNKRNARMMAGRQIPNGYYYTSVAGVRYANHRLVFKLATGTEPLEIDHINRSRSDNRIANLRSCTRSQNQGNRVACSHNSSGFKGVYFNYKRWTAAIHHEGVRHHLGSYATKEEAADAYRQAAEKLFGEFARTS